MSKGKVSLYSSRCANYDRATDRTLSTLLVVHNVKTVANVMPPGARFGFVIVEAPFDVGKPYSGLWYTLSDNGGEVQVSLINGGWRGAGQWVDVGVPFTHFAGRTITAETMAYRIVTAMKAHAIDWDFEAPSLGEWVPSIGAEPLALVPKALERMGAYIG